jgi:predicted secreted protein
MHRSKHNTYSITSPPSKNIELGAVSLSAFAVLRLICAIQEQSFAHWHERPQRLSWSERAEAAARRQFRREYAMSCPR